MNDVDAGNSDTVTGVDRLMVGIGVSMLVLPLTFATLIFRPSRLACGLGRQSSHNSGAIDQEQQNSSILGPGLFFVFSLIFSIIILRWMIPGGEAIETPAVLQNQDTYSSGFKAGTALGVVISSFVDRLSVGNLWSAIALLVPVYLFALVVALTNRLLVGLLNSKWTAAHAVGASLYLVGGLALWLAVVMIVFSLSIIILPALAAVFILLALILTAIGLTGMQSYGMAAPFIDRPDYRLGLISAAIPVLILGLIGIVLTAASS